MTADQILPPNAPSKGWLSGSEVFDRLRALAPRLSPFASHPIPVDIDVNAIPRTSIERRQASVKSVSLDQDGELPDRVLEQQDAGTAVKDTPAGNEESVLYLAYGSNMSAQTFLGMRGIKPLSQIPVLVPGLHLTFDLPGVPYFEPCFAGTGFRDPSAPNTPDPESDEDISLVTESEFLSEKAMLVDSIRERNPDYTGRHWHKPLVGVVYEVSLADYAKIIATEGGGRGYRDTVIDCYPFADHYTPADPVPNFPSTQVFKSHTLLSPTADEQQRKMGAAKTGNMSSIGLNASRQSFWTINAPLRTDPEWAQPSARYLNLLRSGAAEHKLPLSYREYLSQIHHFHTTTIRQKIGTALFVGVWGPVVLISVKLGSFLAGPDGRTPDWLANTQNLILIVMWHAYDYFYKPLFGDGERTINDTQF